MTDRLVEPLLGGVYAGRAREISARAATPQLVALAERGLDPRPGRQPPGLRRPGVRGHARRDGRPGRRVGRGAGRAHGRAGHGAWCGPVGSRLAALAPQPPSTPWCWRRRPRRPRRLLAELAPEAARELAEIEYASMAVVTLAFRAADVPRPGRDRRLRLPGAAGRRAPDQGVDVLVREVGLGARGRATGCCCLRTSARPAPRGGDPAGDRRRAGRRRRCSDLADATGLAATPVDTHVQRWGGACRSTPSATSTGWPGSAPTWPRCRASRSPGRRTTAWASPP